MPFQAGLKASLNAGQMARDLLTPILGEFVAKTSVSMASKRIGKTPDTLAQEDLPKLSEALRPALRTLLGLQAADSLVEQLRNLGHS